MARMCLALALFVLQCGIANAVPLAFAPGLENDAAEGVRTDFGFDYMHLVQEWPGSFCDGKRGCVWPKFPPQQDGFLLHGLWPEFLNGSWPQFCDSSSPYNASAIKDLLPELHKYWPSLVSPDQDSFWAHEWNKHGTCCEKLTPREHVYFQLVLLLRSRFDATAILANAGITPAPSSSSSDETAPGTTSWRAVKKALDGAFGKAVEVGCSRDAKGRLQLSEVRSCYAPLSSARDAEERGEEEELRVGKVGVGKLTCPKEMEYGSCKGPDEPLLFPAFHPALP